MKLKKKLFMYAILVGGFFAVMYITLVVLGDTNLDWTTIFHSFGVTFLLGGIMLIVGKPFFDQLKLISFRAWRICLFAYFLFVVLLLPKIGDSMIVEKEGWLSLYKHPFVWLILALLAGDVILYFFKHKNSTKVS